MGRPSRAQIQPAREELPRRRYMSTELQAALIGALIGALVGGSFALLGTVLQHYLALREDRIRRERDESQKEQDHWVDAPSGEIFVPISHDKLPVGKLITDSEGKVRRIDRSK